MKTLSWGAAATAVTAALTVVAVMLLSQDATAERYAARFDEVLTTVERLEATNLRYIEDLDAAFMGFADGQVVSAVDALGEADRSMRREMQRDLDALESSSLPASRYGDVAAIRSAALAHYGVWIEYSRSVAAVFRNWADEIDDIDDYVEDLDLLDSAFEAGPAVVSERISPTFVDLCSWLLSAQPTGDEHADRVDAICAGVEE